MKWRLFQKQVRAQSESVPSTPRRRGRRSRQVAAALMVVIAGVAGGGAWLYVDQQRGATRDPNLVGPPEPSLAATALNTARDVGSLFRESISRDLSSISGLLNRTGDEPDEAPAEEAVAEEGPAASIAPPARPVAHRIPTKPPEVLFGIGAPTGRPLPPEPPLFMVFDHRHPDVTPPGTSAIRLRSEFLPGSPLLAELTEEFALEADTRSGVEQVGLVEVVISETGEVEHAKLLATPQNVHESMLLSAIKAWRFEPADKGGQSVRYRQVMPITVVR